MAQRGIQHALLALIPLLGCGSDGETAADACSVLKPQVLAACALPDDAAADVTSGISITGTVDAREHGAWDCDGIGRSQKGRLGARAWRFHVHDATRGMWVGVALPWQTRFVAIGDEVAIFYRLGRQISFSPQDPSVLTILDSQDELVFWAAEAGTTQLLPRPAGVEVHDSSEGCAYEDGSFHGDRRGFELEMHEEKTLLPYGELAELAGYVAVHGGNDHGSVTDGTCSDCFTAISSVALARGSLDELEATSE